jgi:hypothetical protein
MRAGHSALPFLFMEDGMTDSEHTIHVCVAEDYKPRTPHVIMYDIDPIHPDAPVMIKSNTSGTFHVARTTQVMRLIRDGMLERTKATSPEVVQEPVQDVEETDSSDSSVATEPQPESDSTQRRGRGRSRKN